MSSSPKKRPTGIAILAILWIIGSIFNLYQGLSVVIADLEILPYVSDPSANEWFRVGVPAEMIVGLFIVAFGFLTLIVVYGLYTAKSWSYDFGLAIPVFITVINIATMGLYLSAPRELELEQAGLDVAPIIVVNLVWLLIVWSYLSRPYVKQYLNRIPSPPPVPVPAPPVTTTTSVTITTSEEKKFCRYCGAENKTDAVFCEKCGRKIE